MRALGQANISSRAFTPVWLSVSAWEICPSKIWTAPASPPVPFTSIIAVLSTRALERNDVGQAQGTERSARASRFSCAPWAEQRLNSGPEVRHLMRFPMNCSPPNDRRSAAISGETPAAITSTRASGRAFRIFCRKCCQAGKRGIEIDNEKIGVIFAGESLGIGQRTRHERGMAGCKFLQGRTNCCRQGVVFFDEKNGRSRYGFGRRSMGSRHVGGSSRLRGYDKLQRLVKGKDAQVACLWRIHRAG